MRWEAYLDCHQLHWIDLSLLYFRVAGSFLVKHAADVEGVLFIFACFGVLARLLQNIPVLIIAPQAINPYELRLDTFLLLLLPLLLLLSLLRCFRSLLLGARLSPEPSLARDSAIIRIGNPIFCPFKFGFLPHARLLDFPYLDPLPLLAFRRARVPTGTKVTTIRFALFRFRLSVLP